MAIGAILLAAGASRRFGADNKLLAAVGGRPMVVRAAEALLGAGLPVIAVLGHEAGRVRAALEDALRDPPSLPASHPRDPLPIRFVTAESWADGMGESISAGVAAVPPDWEGALIALGDMPFVSSSVLRAIAQAVVGPHAVGVPVWQGQRGNPVAFGRAWLPRLRALRGDAGARRLIADAAVTLVAAEPGVLHDFDTRDALSKLAPHRASARERPLGTK
ncbi:MAG: nucleotidyltransferase family protein [Sphingomonadaceae bacterium]|nr:nucleotidyltransferase family protein [Sphingomonadaceae bacterium]